MNDSLLSQEEINEEINRVTTRAELSQFSNTRERMIYPSVSLMCVLRKDLVCYKGSARIHPTHESVLMNLRTWLQQPPLVVMGAILLSSGPMTAPVRDWAVLFAT
uniref:Uncharacterized protein n=1 Tax=Anguilla anguilla TaxID=7936 RepID=A0A0E9S1B6_ANGAN